MIRYSDTLRIAPRPRDLPLGGGLRAAIWDQRRPLAPDSAELLYGVIVQVASDCFATDMSPYWQGKARNDYLERVTRFFVVGDAGDRPVGIAAYHRLTLGQRRCLYWDATAVVPDMQRSGVLKKLIAWTMIEELARNRLGEVFLTWRTESPTVYYGFRRFLEQTSLYPSMERSPPPLIREVAADVAGWLGQADKLVPDTLRIANAFDGPCPWRWTRDLEELPACHADCPDPSINEFFRRQLRPEDTFLLVSRLDLRGVGAMVGRIARSLWRRRAGA
ncbi:MAG TPA: GNAT family N-acetyltransferase [Kofleriaceae bacterium]|nr:GNAT family N-acetyltransferase [Kofleriaceae bacterium]